VRVVEEHQGMSNSDITDQADWMKSDRALRSSTEAVASGEGCLECAADVLSKVLDLSRPVPVPEELVQAAIRVFPAPPPPMKPSSAPALPVPSPRFTYTLEEAQPEPPTVSAESVEDVVDGLPSVEAVVTAGTSKR
jgi:hypothetical protein